MIDLALSITLAFGGIAISFYIYLNKRRGNKLVCMLKKYCHEVSGKDYSRTFGIPNEFVGIAFYLFILAAFLVLLAGLTGEKIMLYDLIKLCATLALIASVFLIYVQAFVLKEWCRWCLASAFINVALFVLTVFLLPVDKLFEI